MVFRSSKQKDKEWAIEFGLIKSAYRKQTPHPIDSYFTITGEKLIFAADRELPPQLKEIIINAFNIIY